MPVLLDHLYGPRNCRLHDLPWMRTAFVWGVNTLSIKYIGCVVEIIYQAKSGQITQRRIVVHAVSDGRVRGYDLVKRAPRVFDARRILAMQLVNRYVG